jgi:hypothetical protein
MNINKNDTAVLVTDPQNDTFISRRPGLADGCAS